MSDRSPFIGEPDPNDFRVHFLCPAEIIELDTKKRFWAGWVMLSREDGFIRTEGLLDSPSGTLRPIDLPARTELRIRMDRGQSQ